MQYMWKIIIMTAALLITSVDGSIAAVSPPVIVKADPFSPMLVKTGAGTVSVKAGTVVSVGGAAVPLLADTPVSMPTLVGGTDYRVIIKADGTFQAIDYSTAIPQVARLSVASTICPAGIRPASSRAAAGRRRFSNGPSGI